MEQSYQKAHTKGLFIGLPCNAKCGFCNAENGFGERFGFLDLNSKDGSFEKLSVLKAKLISLHKQEVTTVLYQSNSFKQCEFIEELIQFGIKLGVKKQRFIHFFLPKEEDKYMNSLGYKYEFYREDFNIDVYNKLKYFHGFDVRSFIPLDKVKQHLKIYKEEGVECVVYEGGDFSIYPHIFEVLEYGQSLGLSQTFQTNGIMLANRTFVEKLKSYGVEDINFSLHSYKQENSDAIMGVPEGGFQKTLQAVKNCVDVGMTVSQNVVITPDNQDDLDWIILQALKLRIDLISFILFIPPEDKIKQNDQDYIKRYTPDPFIVGKKISQGLYFLNEVEKIADTKLINIKFHNIPLCLLDSQLQGGREYIFDVFRRHKSSGEYTEGTGFFKKKECQTCMLNESCAGITQYYVDKFGQDYIIPID